MAYSRWSNSRWYTFWCVHPTESKKRSEQIFEICDSPGICFTFKELSENIYDCLTKVKEHYSKEHKVNFVKDLKTNKKGKTEIIYEDRKIRLKSPTIKEINELSGYMKLFIKDVLDDPELIN